MKLYWAPRTCASGIHVLLEEIGAPYSLVEVDVRGGANWRAPFIDLNPKGKVPVLALDDGRVLTEYTAIALWLARSFPEAQLIPEYPDGEMRVMEAMAYLVGTVHGQGFTRFFRPERFNPDAREDAKAWEDARARGREIATRGLEILGRDMGDNPFVTGERFTIADSALFYVSRWIALADVAAPANILSHFDRMRARPAVQRASAMWMKERA
jgi:glutathione S-transferase